MTMMIDEEAAVAALGEECLGILRDCVEAAWDKFEHHFRPILPLCSPGAMATIVHELTLEEARRRFGPETGVVVRDALVQGKRFMLEVPGKCIVRFKKLTKDFQTSNYPTETAVAFDAQQLVRDYPGLPRLTVGYQLGQYRTSITGIYLAFLIGKDVIWYRGLDEAGGSTVIEFPRSPDMPSAADIERAEEAAERAADDEDEAEVGNDD